MARAGVKERNDAGAHLRLGGDGIGQIALFVGGAGNNRQIIRLAWRQVGKRGGGHVPDGNRLGEATTGHAVVDDIAENGWCWTGIPGKPDGIREARGDDS